MPVSKISKQSSRTVSLSQWGRLVALYSFIPLVLFICSGFLGWWQAWVYTLLILTSGVGGRIWAEKRHPGLTAERQDKEIFQNAKSWDKILAPLMAVSIVFPMVIVAGLDYRYNWSPDFPLWLNLTGIILIAMGYAFASWAVTENRFFYSVVCIRKDYGHKVCDSGPYRIVRHPAYSGNIIALFGIVFALDSWWSLIPAVFAITITTIRTVLEDKVLQKELTGYQCYVQRVGYRLIPGVF